MTVQEIEQEKEKYLDAGQESRSLCFRKIMVVCQ